MELRPYQNEAIDAINTHWNDWQRELLVLPTGCGKTVVFNTIAHDRPGKVLILAHREELIEQARDKYFKMFGELTGKIKAQENEIKRVTVGSVQTMSRRNYSGMFDTVIIDEAHHAISDSYQNVLSQFSDAHVLGVTATPDRGDKKSLAQYFEGIAYEYKLKQAIEDGYLCKITARTVPLKIDMNNVKVSIGDFQLDSVAETLEPYLPQIADAIIKYAADRKTVVFCPLISIAQELASMISGAREVNGSSEDRKETLEWFDNADKGAVLCNAMLLTEGWDCPSCDCVVVLRPTKVRSLYCQMIGRGTRLFPGKDNMLILDFLWMCQKHNLCKPASLVADNQEDIEHVVRKSEKDEIDLFDAISDAEKQRRNSLAAELARQANKKSILLDALAFWNLADDLQLNDYEPTFKWEQDDASEKQIAALERFGIDASCMTKGYACAVYERLMGKPTKKMVSLLARFGFDAKDWTIEQAKNYIGKIQANGWKRPKFL